MNYSAFQDTPYLSSRSFVQGQPWGPLWTPLIPMKWLGLCPPGNAVLLFLLFGQGPGLACSLSAGSGICVSWLWEAFSDLGVLLCRGLDWGQSEGWGHWKTAFWDGLRDITQLGFLSGESEMGYLICPF